MTIKELSQELVTQGSDLAERVRAAGSLDLRQRDELLYELVLAYRSGERSVYAQLILELLRPFLRIRVSRYRPVEPATSIQDVYQQLVLAVLQDSRTIPLQGPERLERRLALRAADRVSRWLQQEARRQVTFESLEAWAEQHEGDDEEGDEDA
jgi:hypothetical protein